MSLEKDQIRRLRGLAHALSPVVIVGDKGLTENVRAEIDDALRAHELIKVKLRGERAQRTQWCDRVVRDTGADLVQQIGQVIVLYRRSEDRPHISLE